MGFFDKFKKTKEVDIHELTQQMDQNIFDILQDYLPKNWQEVIFFAGYYKDDSGYFKYWVKQGNGQYINCFNLIPAPNPGEKDILQEQLMKLHNEMKFVRTKLDIKQKWVCMEMFITNQGQLSKKYNYADGVAEENLYDFVVAYKNMLNKRYE